MDIRLQETRVYQEAQEEAAKMALRLLTLRLGQELSEEMRNRITCLPLAELEALSEALLDFSTIVDLETWLKSHGTEEQ